MLPQHHFLLGLIFSFILFLIFPQISILGIVIIVLSSVMIDVDHYVWYVWNKRDLSLSRAIKWFKEKRNKIKSIPKNKRKEYSSCLLIFHGMEFPIILLILTIFVHEYFGFVFIGVMFHLFLDYFEQWPITGRKDKLSFILDYFWYKGLKRI